MSTDKYSRAYPANPSRVLSAQTSYYLGQSFKRLKNHVLHFRHLWVNSMSFDDVVSDVVYTLSQKLLDRFDDGSHHDYPQFLAFQRESVRYCVLEAIAAKQRENKGLTFVEFDNTAEETLLARESLDETFEREDDAKKQQQQALIDMAIRTKRQRQAADIAKQDRLSAKDLGQATYDKHRASLRQIRRRLPKIHTRRNTQ